MFLLAIEKNIQSQDVMSGISETENYILSY